MNFCKFALFCCICFVELVVSVESNKVQLRRIKSGMERMLEKGTWADYVRNRRQKVIRQQPVGQHGTVPEKDYSDTRYVAEVQIGTPAQTFYVVPDTGSSNFWVPDQTCQDETLESCVGKTKFYSSRSSTYAPNGQSFSIVYGTGSCDGFFGWDTVQFADISCPNTMIGQVTQLAAFFMQQEGMDGILGLGWPTISEGSQTPVVSKMISQGSLDQTMFAIYMNRVDKDGDIGGELYLGGYDSRRYTGSITWVPLASEDYWQFTMSRVTVGSTTAGAGTYKVISDSGTSMIAGPSYAIASIASTIGATYDSDNEIYTINCDTDIRDMPFVTFTINGQPFTVTSKNYMIKVGQICFIGFQPIPTNMDVDWILGDVFIRAYYNIYDIGNQQLGLALANVGAQFGQDLSKVFCVIAVYFVKILFS